MREVELVLEGENNRRFRDQELAYYGAWYSGVFSQPYAKGKFPRFEKAAPKRGKGGARTGRQSWQQQKSLALALTALMGGTITKRKD